MFCILLCISRILDYVLLQASVVEPAWERSRKGGWMFTLGDCLSWAVLLGLPSTLRMCRENLLPFQKSFFFFFLSNTAIFSTMIYLKNELYGI